MPRIPRKAFARPLQGNARVVGMGGRRPIGLAGQYQQAMDQANAANEKRYQQILQGYQGLRGRVMGDLQGMGAQESSDINRDYGMQSSNMRQSLINRGFGNSNLWMTMNNGVNRERMAAQGRLNDRMRQQRSAADIGISQGEMGVMERRTDAGPDYNQMLQLMQNLGASGYGQNGMGPGVRGVTFNQDGFADMHRMAMMRHMMNAVPRGPNWRAAPLVGMRGGGGYGSDWRKRRYS